MMKPSARYLQWPAVVLCSQLAFVLTLCAWQMGSKSIFISTAHPSVCREEALVKALQSEQIAAAGLDFPGTNIDADEHPLLSLSNCIVLADNAAEDVDVGDQETRDRIHRMAINNIFAALFYHSRLPVCKAVEKPKDPDIHRVRPENDDGRWLPSPGNFYYLPPAYHEQRRHMERMLAARSGGTADGSKSEEKKDMDDDAGGKDPLDPDVFIKAMQTIGRKRKAPAAATSPPSAVSSSSSSSSSSSAPLSSSSASSSALSSSS